MEDQNNQSQGQDNNQYNNQNNSQNSTPVAQNTGGNRTIMGVLSYLGPLVIVSYLVSKDDPFVKFHIKQGLVIFGIEVIVWALGSMMWSFMMLLNIVNLGTFILSIIGIINVVQSKEKELPLVGSFANNLKI